MKQPLFYPGKKLDAEDLISLEDYAFSRVNIISPDHGVVSLYTYGSQPNYKSERDECFFILEEIRGVTPEGRPIKFKANGIDRPALSLPYPARGVFVWDIYIDDTHPADKTEAKKFKGEKYRLSHRPINFDERTQSDEKTQTEHPAIEKSKLYIGRYKLTPEHHPEVVAPPYIFSLASFNFPSQWWQDWTYPIRQALRNIVVSHKDYEYVTSYVKHILYNYPFWPLSQLLKASNELAWLCSQDELESLLDEGAMAELQHSQISNPLPGSVYHISPIEIPTKIGEILGSLERKLWKLIDSKQYSHDEGMLTVNLPLKDRHEIKFKFKPGVDVNLVERIIIDNFFERNPVKLEEKDNFNQICSCYVIDYIGTSGAGNFKVSIPKKWQQGSFSVYYRTIVEK